MKLLRVPILFLLAAFLTRGTYSPTNLGNGWYGNLPPVTEAALAPILGCLTQHGAPSTPKLIAEGVFDWGDGRAATPTMVQWDIGNGLQFRNDAVLTYYGPAPAYVEVIRALTGVQPTRAALQAFEACVRRVKEPTVIVSVPNPLGEKQAPEWCTSRVGVSECWQGNQRDQFLPGGEFNAPDGLYRKVNGGWFFLTWSAWRKV